MYSNEVLMKICASILLVSVRVSADTFIFDEFDDGDIATNISNVGGGFETSVGGIASVVEEEGVVRILGGDSGANRSQIGSKDPFSANGSPVFGIFTVTDMYRSQSADNGTARFYIGFSDALPNAQGPLQTSTVNGLWIVLHGRYTYTGVDTWNTGDGGLVYVNGGIRTALAQWTWDSSVFTFDTASGFRSDRVALDMIASDLTFVLSSDADGYSLSISSTDGRVILPEAVSGTWGDAGLTNVLSNVYASAWIQGASPGNEMGLVLDKIVVNEEGWAGGTTFPLARSPAPKDGSMLEATWANLSWREGDLAVSHDLYFGTDFDDVNDGAEGTFVGNLTATLQVVGFPGFPAPEGLQPGTTYYWRVDEVNDADPNSPWKGDVWSLSIQPYTAYDPKPADGAEFVGLEETFGWMPGFGAALHTFYIRTDRNEVENAEGGVPQAEATFKPGPLEAEKVYYWRVDEFDGTTTRKGDVWAFTTPGAVGNPQPANGAADVPMTATLSWTAADNATSHDLYLGIDADAVENATTASPEYVAARALGVESYDPGGLAWDSSYVWRVDEVYPDGTIKGLVWTFSTADFLLVDDFEAYNDIDPPDPNSNRVFDRWIDGFGTTTNGALVGNDLPPYAEQNIVHGGAQSMIYRYDNTGKTSEVTLTLEYPRDWTEEGVAKLSLWFRGNAANVADRIFVALNGTAAIYHEDPAATQLAGWNEWVIDLEAFGVTLTNVNTITIGVGTKDSPTPDGGAGTLYFDDIRLYR